MDPLVPHYQCRIDRWNLSSRRTPRSNFHWQAWNCKIRDCCIRCLCMGLFVFYFHIDCQCIRSSSYTYVSPSTPSCKFRGRCNYLKCRGRDQDEHRFRISRQKNQQSKCSSSRHFLLSKYLKNKLLIWFESKSYRVHCNWFRQSSPSYYQRECTRCLRLWGTQHSSTRNFDRIGPKSRWTTD